MLIDSEMLPIISYYMRGGPLFRRCWYQQHWKYASYAHSTYKPSVPRPRRKGSSSLNNLPSAISSKEHVQVGTLLGATIGALIGQQPRVDLLELLLLSHSWCCFSR